MIQNADFVFLCCLFLAVESLTDKVLPPTNLSLQWSSNYDFHLFWVPPPHSMKDCKYEVTTKTKVKFSEEIDENVDTVPWNGSRVMEGGFLELSVETVCGLKKSGPAVLKNSYPDLVKNFECKIKSLQRTHCSWLIATNAPDLRFFYRLVDNDFTVSIHDKPSTVMYECKPSGGIRNGCDLQAKPNQSLYGFFNGTLDNKPVRNSFKRELDHVEPPALEWTVTKTKNDFIINWTSPGILHLTEWTFVVNYTECSTQREKKVTGKTYLKLPKRSDCPYQMSIQARAGQSMTPWTKKKSFDAETDGNAMIYAAIIIPLMFAGLAALAFVCYRKNKEIIFPKIPEPRDLLSGISNNNNKSFVHNLFVPAEEEEHCKITLVIDPQTDKPCS